MFSSKTHRTSKNRRKHQKKLFNLKEGNKFEDIALIDVLYKLIMKIYSNEHQMYIKEILTAALQLKLDKEAKVIQVRN